MPPQNTHGMTLPPRDLVMNAAGASAVVWGMAKASGASDKHDGHKKFLVRPQKLPGTLCSKEAVSAVSAGWCHTAFVTGKADRPFDCSLQHCFKYICTLKFKSNTCTASSASHHMPKLQSLHNVSLTRDMSTSA